MLRRRQKILNLLHAVLEIFGRVLQILLALLFCCIVWIGVEKGVVWHVGWSALLRALLSLLHHPIDSTLVAYGWSTRLVLCALILQRGLQHANLARELLVDALRLAALSLLLGNLCLHLRPLDIPRVPSSFMRMPLDLQEAHDSCEGLGLVPARALLLPLGLTASAPLTYPAVCIPSPAVHDGRR